MKRFTSIKTRITIWYTTLMFVLISVVLALVGTLSYRLSIDNIESDVKYQVNRIADKVWGRISSDTYLSVENSEEFKNVTIYRENGEYVVGQFLYDLSDVPFKHELRRETVDGEVYIVYDEFKPSHMGERNGYWIRGAQSIKYTKVLGHSVLVILIFVMPIILALTVMGGYFITKRAFLPINAILETANDISERNDVKQRIPIGENCRRDELYNLSVTLNRMLDKIEGMILREKQFTSDASHELRTPISVILAQGEYLLDIAEGDKERELAGDIVDKAKLLSKLVSRLLLLARIDQNRQAFNKEKVDLGVILDIAVDSVKPLADKKGIYVFSDVADGLMIDADEALFVSALTNLLSNGVKYGREGGYVTVSASKIGCETEITVKDNGIGISNENIDKIWDRFFRADDARNDEYGSSGLGLAMVKSIVKLHGGVVFVRSDEGKGTEFKIVLKSE